MTWPDPAIGVPAAGRGERGSTLVEVLIATMILSVLLLGIMAGISSTATISQANGQGARARVALATATDRLATIAFPGCVTPAALTASLPTMITIPAGYTVTVSSVESLPDRSAACTPSTSMLLLKVVMEHASPSSKVSGEIVLRDRNAKPS